MTDRDRKDTVRAVDRAIDILNVFTFENNELSLAQICNVIDLPKTTIYRLLLTMEQRGIVTMDSQTLKYRLGHEIIKLGAIAQQSNPLSQVAKEEMEAVSKATDQTCNLYIREGIERRCIAQVAGAQYVRRYSYLGARYPLYCGAGKLLLAYADPDFQEHYLQDVQIEKYTEHTITDPEKLRLELEQIRQDGYSVTLGERDASTAMVSAPIFNYTEKVIASITVSGPVYTFTEDHIKFYRTILLEAARRISQKLGSSALRPHI